MFDGLKKMLGLDANDRALKRYSQIVNEVNDLEESIAILSDEDLVREINDIRKNVSENGQPLDEVMCRVFAIVREAARRSLGMRHFDVQIMGASASCTVASGIDEPKGYPSFPSVLKVDIILDKHMFTAFAVSGYTTKNKEVAAKKQVVINRHIAIIL